MMLRAVFFAACLGMASADLTLQLANDGSYAIDGYSIALKSGPTMFGPANSADGSLVMTGAPANTTGTDPLGSYTATTMSWSKTKGGSVVMATSFRTYASDADMIVFEQSFPATVETGATLKLNEDAKNMEKSAACRIDTGSYTLTASSKGFSAWTSDGKGGYTSHTGQYCGNGKGAGAIFAYDGNEDVSACQAKCAKMKCTCFDHSSSAPGPGPKPHRGGLSSQTLFPSFARNTGPTDDLKVFSYHGVFPGMQKTKFASYTESHQGGVPLTIHSGDNVLVFSPLNFPKASHMATSPHFVGAGVKSTVTSIPGGWSQMFLLSASGKGVNAGMMAWGDRMLKFTGKPRADKYRDATHSTIGFWTDNGGYYHYALGNKSMGSTYEEVLPKVKAYHDEIGVPFHHWQFDSWFYPKDGSVNAGGGGGSVINWTAMPSVFPSGMAAIQDKLKVPIVMHNRQWGDNSDYVKNWTDIKWYGPKDSPEPSKYAIPEDPTQFFTKFFTQQDGWGLTMYEQDWMGKEYDGVDALQTNITMGDAWLKGMAAGAGSSNRTIQYCMPYSHDVLSASAYAEVTNARATGDYFHAADQWNVADTSLFYWAIGILPFKDGFYSSSSKQVGGQTVGPERNPDREIIFATLSTAMVGPMDGIDLLNKTRTMASCTATGTVLKPDRPVSTVDYCFGDDAPPMCRVASTYSDVTGLGRVYYVFNNEGGSISADMIKGGDAAPSAAPAAYYAASWYAPEEGIVALAAGKTTDIGVGYEGHGYAVVSPALGGWVFLGELNKYVTASSVRGWSVSSSSSGQLSVTLSGSAETVQVCAASVQSAKKVVCKEVTFNTQGSQTVQFP